MNTATPKQRLVSGVVWMTAAKALSQSITWVITIFVVRLLTPQDYGLMGMAVLFSGFLSLFSEIGLGVAIIQKKELRDDHLSHLRWVISGVNLLFFLVLLLGAPVVAAYFREPRLVVIVRALATAFVMQSVGAPSGYLLQRRMAFREKARAEFIGSVAGGVSSLLMALSGLGVWSLVFGYLVQQFLINALYCISAPLPVRLTFSARGLSEFINFGGQVALSRVLWYVASNADFMIVGRMLGSVQLGYYSLAFQFSSLPIDKLVTIVSQVAFPSFSSVQHDEAVLTRHYLKLVSAIALVTFPMFVGLALVAGAAVEMFLTTKWLPVVVPLQILCVVACLRAVETLNSPLVIARGQPRVSVLNNLTQAIVLPLSFYVGARYGLQGVALAWLVTRPFLFIFLTLLTLQTIGLRFSTYLSALKYPVIGCLLMTLSILPVQRFLLRAAPLTIQLVLSCVLGFVVYAGYQLMFNQQALREGLEVLRARHTRRSAMAGKPSEATPAA